MHEVGLLAAAVTEIVAANGQRPVTRVDLAIGPGVDDQVIRQAWRAASAGTAAERAEVNCTRADDTLACLACGQSYAGDRLTCCPTCGGTGLVVLAAPEVEVMGWSACPPDRYRS